MSVDNVTILENLLVGPQGPTGPSGGGTPGPPGPSGPAGPNIPLLLPQVDTVANLPPAGDFPGYVAITTDQGLWESNGIFWSAVSSPNTTPILPGIFTFATLPSSVANPNVYAATSDKGAVFSNGGAWLLLFNPTNGTVQISSNAPLPGGVNGTAYSTTLGVTNAVAPVTWSIVSLFSSLNQFPINATTGVIALTPTHTEISVFMVQVIDATGASDQKLMTINVAPAPLTPAATPTFLPVAGSYSTAQSVTISCSTPSASIFYTTNGSTPTTSSTPYTAPITVSITSVVQAVAIASGFSQSAVGSAAYTITTAGAQYKFNPGDYMLGLNFNGTSNGNNAADFALIATVPTVLATSVGVKGYIARYGWPQLETTQGSYAAMAATILTDYNNLQAKNPGARFGVGIASDFNIPGTLHVQDYPTHQWSNQIAPNWILNCGGTLNVFNTPSYPTSSGATTAFTLGIQINGQCGYGFTSYVNVNNNDPTQSFYIGGATAFWDPGVNKAWKNFWFALSKVPLPYSDGNTYTLDTHPLVELMLDANEVSYNFNQGPYKPVNTGSSNVASVTNFWNNYISWATATCAAFPHTMIGANVTYQVTGSDGSTDTLSSYNVVNGYLSPSKLGAITGLALCGSDTWGANWTLNAANALGGQAQNSVQAFIGIQNPTGEVNTTPTENPPINAALSLQGKMPIWASVQDLDYNKRMMTTPSFSGGSSPPRNSAAGVNQIIASANGSPPSTSGLGSRYSMGASHRLWNPVSAVDSNRADWGAYIQSTFKVGLPVNSVRPNNLP